MNRQTLFTAGEMDTAGYRIPALIALPGGRVLAFCEARKHSLEDWGTISIAQRVSLDCGHSFSPARVIYQTGHTVGNPSPIYDPHTGRLWLLMNGEDKSVNEADILRGVGGRQTLIGYSDDLGDSWSELKDLTPSLTRPDWTWHAFGPCHGVCLSNGRLAVGCNHAVYRGDGESGPYTAHVSYSDDHGLTWHIGADITPFTNECALAEVAPGLLYANMRSYAGKNRRCVAYSANGGDSWSPASLDDALTEPVCQGSANTLTANGRTWLLFLNPADTRRRMLTLRASADGGRTWPHSLVIESGPAAYGDIAIAPDNSILCLFECGENHTYERIDLAIIPLADLIGGL